MAEQLYPFSKNRYFKGKRMRSLDFEREQVFFDHKLAFINHWNFGEGIALGLGVQRVDSDTLLVESGFAIDEQGRYLIVDEPAICRVRTLDGFDDVSGETAVLWLSYKEEKFDPVFIADERGESQDHAAAMERFSFTLSDKCPLPSTAADRLLFSDTILFEDDELRIRQIIPKVLSSGWHTQLQLVVESFCLEEIEVELYYAPIIPGFTAVDTGGTIELSQRLQVARGETVLPFSICASTAAQIVCISLPESSFFIEKRGSRMRAQYEFHEDFTVVHGDPMEPLEEKLLAQSPQDLWNQGSPGIPIAHLRFVRYDGGCLLDDVIPLGKDRLIAVPYLREQLRRAKTFFTPVHAANDALHTATKRVDAPKNLQMENQRMTTGTITLNAGLHLKEGKILCSEELSHDLGLGTVFVSFGVENIYPAVNLNKNRTDLLLGDVTLFEQASGTYESNFDRGVRVHPEKGTFELAVRLRGELRQAALRLRWFAWRPDELVPYAEHTGALIRLEPDVIYVAPGAVVTFVPVFIDGAGRPCNFSVVGKQAGIITRDGVYTAPEKEGLYQVSAQIQDKAGEAVKAFVIVRQEERNESGAV